MSVLQLIQLTRGEFADKETTLRRQSADIVDFSSQVVTQAIDDLTDTLYAHRVSVALAAPQIGIQLRLIAVNISKGKVDPTLILGNPRIKKSSPVCEERMESCMSLPHFRGPVERPKRVTVDFQDRTGNPQSLVAEGFMARVLCHEIDHLDGVLYVDRIKDWSRLESVEFFKED